MKMTRIERRWARDIMATIYPRAADPRLPMGIADLDTDAFCVDVMRSFPWLSAIGFRAVVFLITMSPLLVIGRFRTFSGLNEADRTRVLDRFSKSRFYTVRSLVTMVKALASMLYAGSNTVRSSLLVPAPATAAAGPALVTLRRSKGA